MRSKLGNTGLVCIFALALGASGCQSKQVGQSAGFAVGTGKCVHPMTDPDGSPCNLNVDSAIPWPNIPVSGGFARPIPGVQTLGSVNQFGINYSPFTNVETQTGDYAAEDGLASYFINNAVMPAFWDLYYVFPTFCGYDGLYAQGVLPGTIIPFWEYTHQAQQVSASPGRVAWS